MRGTLEHCLEDIRQKIPDASLWDREIFWKLDNFATFMGDAMEEPATLEWLGPRDSNFVGRLVVPNAKAAGELEEPFGVYLIYDPTWQPPGAGGQLEP
jgi:hypothetical protein